jgi:endonuclease/exonuclease/phosphatase family metal-dependent hydrolase
MLPLARAAQEKVEPASTVEVELTPRAPQRPREAGLTLVSANLWHDWPRQRRWSERLESVAQLMEAEQVDIALLQEVARTRSLLTDVWLAERLGMSVAYARGNGSRGALGFEEGLVVLSRHPLGAVHVRQLSRSRNPLVRRIALAAQVQTPHGDVLAVSAHLGLLRHESHRQIAALQRWVGDVAGDRLAVVGGDFNATEEHPGIRSARRTWIDAFRHAHPKAHGGTHVSNRPWRRHLGPRILDYVFLQEPRDRHWLVSAAAHVDAPGGPHSDHRAVLVRIAPE